MTVNLMLSPFSHARLYWPSSSDASAFWCLHRVLILFETCQELRQACQVFPDAHCRTKVRRRICRHVYPITGQGLLHALFCSWILSRLSLLFPNSWCTERATRRSRNSHSTTTIMPPRFYLLGFPFIRSKRGLLIGT